MSRPGAWRKWVSACVICAAGCGSLAAQQTSDQQSSAKYLATAELYRKSAAKNAPERRECFLGWAAYYDSLAAAVRDGIALPPEPNLDPYCPAPGYEALQPGESRPPTRGLTQASHSSSPPLQSAPPVAAQPVTPEPAPAATAGSADVSVSPESAESNAFLPEEDPVPVAAEAEPPVEVAPQEMPVQTPAAALFDGLRYDISKSVSTTADVAPEIRRRIDALQLIMEDLSAAPPNGRAPYLEEFVSASAPVVADPAENPYKFGILTLRTAAFLELNRAEGGRESGGQLLALGAANNSEPSVRRLMAMLERKGWLVQDTGLWAASSGSTASAVAATASLAGSVWSGALVMRDKNRKEVARYGIDLQFTANGNGTAIYRHFSPAFTWTQVGARAIVKSQLSADCALSLDITTDGGTQRGAANWTGTVNPGGNCFHSAGGAKTFLPGEFTATRVATAAPQN